MTDLDLATRLDLHMRPDPSRVVALLFVAGQEIVGGGDSRASGVVARVLQLPEEVVVERLSALFERFEYRHRDLASIFLTHGERLALRLDPDLVLSKARLLLLGATFTSEYSIEAASACNPSVVPHPDQSEAPPGGLRFVMSFRAIGEGHRSSIGFRAGTLLASGEIELDPPGRYCTIGTTSSGSFSRNAFHAKLGALGEDGESAAYVLDHLSESFDADELDARLAILEEESDTRSDTASIAARLRSIASCSYSVEFPAEVELSERVLWSATNAESHGMEDARFVQFVHDDGETSYFATYTAFDGVSVSQQLISTPDFVSFTMSPVVGPHVAAKGLALFPRLIDGRHVALSRYDRESNAVAFSQTFGYWGDASSVQLPRRDWEVVQLGNCGSPIETEAGWLVLTHGVGPMRTYSIGAILLDLKDPTVVIGALEHPILVPAADEQDGYVPNVVYSCGSLLHGDVLLLPYGIADTSIAFATVSLAAILGAMTPA